VRAAEEQLLLVEAVVGRWEDGRAEAEAQVRSTAAEREVAAAEVASLQGACWAKKDEVRAMQRLEHGVAGACTPPPPPSAFSGALSTTPQLTTSPN
jgi:hypothetical protein